jgi:hypothetical protein
MKNSRVQVGELQGVKAMDLKKILTERLEEKGVELVLIPTLLKSILTALKDRPDITHDEISEKLRYIGWNKFEMDENTLQIIKADYEASALNHPALMRH